MINTPELFFQKNCLKNDFLLADKKIRIGIHGMKGSFTDEALAKFTQTINVAPEDYEVKELIHAENVLRALNNNEIERGIFAFANSGSGGYIASVEAMGKYRYEVLALFSMPVNMCILSLPTVKDFSEINEFFGHPVAISQCRHTLQAKWPQIKVSMANDEMDTALSAQLLSKGVIPPTSAVFASKQAAKEYGLKVLFAGAHHDVNNATFFAVVKV